MEIRGIGGGQVGLEPADRLVFGGIVSAGGFDGLVEPGEQERDAILAPGGQEERQGSHDEQKPAKHFNGVDFSIQISGKKRSPDKNPGRC